MDPTITNLEEKIAFMERHVEELDGLVREVFDKLEGLRADMTRFREDTKQQFAERDRTPEDDVPPHWGGGQG